MIALSGEKGMIAPALVAFSGKVVEGISQE